MFAYPADLGRQHTSGHRVLQIARDSRSPWHANGALLIVPHQQAKMLLHPVSTEDLLAQEMLCWFAQSAAHLRSPGLCAAATDSVCTARMQR